MTCQCGKTHKFSMPTERVSIDHPKRPEPEDNTE